MSGRDAFIDLLMGFDLTQEEAQLYFYLLDEGPKGPSSLAEVNAGHEGVQHTLNTLIEKDMVRPSLQSPTTYAAVELNVILEAAMQSYSSELQDMKARQHEFMEFSRQHPLHPAGTTFKMLRNIGEIASTTVFALLSTEAELLWVAPREALLVASTFGINDIVHEFHEHGGCTRGIMDTTHEVVPLVQELLDIGEDVRHFDEYKGMYYAIFDRKQCISAINLDVTQPKPDTPASMFYTDDSQYATHLLFLFELLWKHAIPAQQHIDELLEQG